MSASELRTSVTALPQYKENKKMIENIVIGTPLVDPSTLFSKNTEDWNKVEKPKTLWTTERNLPRLMKEAGVVSSTSEVRRNRPGLCIDLTDVGFYTFKWGKRFLFVLVGE